MKLAPVVVFGYNRPKHIARCLEALNNCSLAEKSDLYIFIDGPKKEDEINSINKVREVVEEFYKCSRFRRNFHCFHDVNIGLANSIISGVTGVILKYKRVIVLEDDLIVNKHFLEYMNGALSFYENCKRIWSISGFSYSMKSLKKLDKDVYFLYRGCSTGWASWIDRWESVDWTCNKYGTLKYKLYYKWLFTLGGCDLPSMLDLQIQGKIDSWAVRWCFEQSHSLKLTVYPRKSLLENIGFDGSGIHSGILDINSSIDYEFGEDIEYCKPYTRYKISEEFRKTEGYSYGRYLIKTIKNMLKRI